MILEAIPDRLTDYLRGEARQFVILTRHFFNRFFINDIVAFEEQMKEKTIAAIALLGGLCGYVANTIFFKYASELFGADISQSWLEKCYFLFFGMLLMGFFTVLEWDVIFPDRRDYMNLASLPVKIRTIFVSKFVSLSSFTILFTLGINSFAVFAVLFYLPKWYSKSVLFLLLFGVVHMAVSFAANFFMFFAFIFLQGLLMTALGPGLFRRLSLLVRFALLTVFVFLLIVAVTESVVIFRIFDTLPALKEKNAALLYAFPPMWFAGLYETLLGNSDPIFHRLALIAAASLAIPVLGFFAAASLSYRRHIRRAWEEKRKSAVTQKIKNSLSTVFNAVAFRNPTQRAVFSFFGKTMLRSQIHKVRFISYLAVAMALSLILMATKFVRGAPLVVTNRTLLSIPLVFSFFLVAGIRSVSSVPAAAEARWIFRLVEFSERKHVFIGFKKAVFFGLLGPLALAVFIISYLLWGWKNAGLHSFFVLTVSTLLLQAVFFRYPKIPFACSYLPGKGRVHLFWLAYFIAFYLYVSILCVIEKELFLAPRNWISFYTVMLILLAGFKIYNDFIFSRKTPFVYDDEPEPVMVTM